jgi:hypothetical protein
MVVNMTNDEGRRRNRLTKSRSDQIIYLSSSPNIVPISLAVAKTKQEIINNPHVILPSGIGIVVYEFDKTLIEI